MDKAKERKVEKAAIDAVLQEGIDFYVTIEHPNVIRRLLRKTERHFVIKPLYLGTLLRISRIMVDMKLPEQVGRGDWMDQGVKLMAGQTEQLLDIVSLAIHNREGNPDKRIKKLLRENVTPVELLALVSYVINQMNVQDFMKSIISIKGMSLINDGGQIARHPEKEVRSGA